MHLGRSSHWGFDLACPYYQHFIFIAILIKLLRLIDFQEKHLSGLEFVFMFCLLPQLAMSRFSHSVCDHFECICQYIIVLMLLSHSNPQLAGRMLYPVHQKNQATWLSLNCIHFRCEMQDCFLLGGPPPQLWEASLTFQYSVYQKG